jgi:pimeloyl-ACP methyl ester carboxylesterase
MTDRPIPLQFDRQGQGLPILCLHGHPGSSRSMGVFVRHLSQRFCTIAPDLRGYGHSRSPGDFAMTAHIGDLVALLDRLQVPQVLVLGWSLGGILALELALRHPERVSGLVLVATAARPRSAPMPSTWRDSLYTVLAAMANQLWPGNRWAIAQWGQRSLLRYLIRQHTPRTYRYLAESAVFDVLRTSRSATRALSQALRQGYDRQPDLAAIRCPALVMAGAHDRHIIPAASQATADALADSRWHCYDNAAHLFPWELPDRLLSDLDRWLADRPDCLPGGRDRTGDRPRTG